MALGKRISWIYTAESSLEVNN